MRLRPRRQVALITAAVTAAALAAIPGSAAADRGRGGPSAAELRQSRADVAAREDAVRRAIAAVAATRDRLDRLAAEAEVAVEAYNEARVERQAAQAAVRAARLVVSAAQHQVAAAERRAGRFGASAYMNGGASAITTILTAPSPDSLFYRVGALQAISVSERDAAQAVDAARVYEVSVERQAEGALATATAAADAADRARQRAQSAVEEQTSLLTSLQQRKAHLDALLADAKANATALQQEHLAAIARAERRQARRAARAAAAAQPTPAPAPSPSAPPPVESGPPPDTTGTVSAAKGQQAVNYAESQIGKPYQWGAAGPDTYDCSGLTMWAYAQVGVHLLHYTGYQWEEGVHVPTSSLRPGDLVFFATDTSDPNTIHHVGMYVGDGNMVEAPHTGADVRISSIWRSDLIGAVRPYDR